MGIGEMRTTDRAARHTVSQFMRMTTHARHRHLRHSHSAKKTEWDKEEVPQDQ